MNYKKITHLSIIAFVAILAIPSISLAVNGTGPMGNQADREEIKEERQADREAKKEEIQTQKTEKTCTQLSSQATQIQNRLTERIAALTQKRTDASEKIAAQIVERTTNRDAKRAAIDAKRAANWETLEAKAQTDEQKAAVAKFEAAVKAAVQIKRAALDKIILDFRTALKTQINDRKTTTDGALTAYKNSVASILSQVKTDCTAGKDAKTIREYFRTEMKNARETFRDNRKPEEKFREEVTPLKDAKKAQIKAVIDTFQASLEAAKAELRAAFPKMEEASETVETPETPETENE